MRTQTIYIKEGSYEKYRYSFKNPFPLKYWIEDGYYFIKIKMPDGPHYLCAESPRELISRFWEEIFVTYDYYKGYKAHKNLNSTDRKMVAYLDRNIKRSAAK